MEGNQHTDNEPEERGVILFLSMTTGWILIFMMCGLVELIHLLLKE